MVMVCQMSLIFSMRYLIIEESLQLNRRWYLDQVNEKYVKKVEEYFDKEYTQKTASSQQWVLRKENRTIRRVAEMAVKALEKDLK